MKRIVGWCIFLSVTPFVICGFLAYLITDAAVAGWTFAKRMVEEWDD